MKQKQILLKEDDMSSFSYNKAEIINGKVVIVETKTIDQSKLTSECWLIQFNGLVACDTCEYLNHKECGGKKIRKRLLKELK